MSATEITKELARQWKELDEDEWKQAVQKDGLIKPHNSVVLNMTLSLQEFTNFLIKNLIQLIP